jgi:hypothetical protein
MTDPVYDWPIDVSARGYLICTAPLRIDPRHPLMMARRECGHQLGNVFTLREVVHALREHIALNEEEHDLEYDWNALVEGQNELFTVPLPSGSYAAGGIVPSPPAASSSLPPSWTVSAGTAVSVYGGYTSSALPFTIGGGSSLGVATGSSGGGGGGGGGTYAGGVQHIASVDGSGNVISVLNVDANGKIISVTSA